MTGVSAREQLLTGLFRGIFCTIFTLANLDECKEMIAVAEPPLDFIPRGRLTVEEHPGPLEQEKPKYLPIEHLLMQRMQNVNISATEEHNEFWCIREVYDDYEALTARDRIENAEIGRQNAKRARLGHRHQHLIHQIELELNQQCRAGNEEEAMSDYIVNNEEELYVNKQTVVWTLGMQEDDLHLYHTSFTCDSPVKFAFFVRPDFVRSKRALQEAAMDPEEEELSAICVIDQKALRVFCNDGEDYIASLEFPVSNVWPTNKGLLLEKVSGNAVIQNLTIPMPRLFSLEHPLDEMCPVVMKTATNATGYLIEPEYNIVFSADDTDFVLLYDTKIFKHFVARVRKVTPEESQQLAAAQNESQLNQTLLQRGPLSSSQSYVHSPSSVKQTGATSKLGTSWLGRNTTGSASNYSAHMSKLLPHSPSFNAIFGHLNRTAAGTPLSHLQSTINQHSLSVQDLRKFPQVKPAKPIEPSLCLEHIWTENNYGTQRDFCEMATRAFIHTDLVAQTFLCYLLPRACRLQMVLINGYGIDNGDVQLAPMPATIPAKDAICLNRMHMLVVLDPSGSLIIYTGTVLISKVHITPGLSKTPPTAMSMPAGLSVTPKIHKQKMGQSPSLNSSFPRRSSLLPTVHKSANSTFEDELHLLSPVHPLPAPFPNRQVCLALRDPAGNRLTLVYSSGKMLRISLPLLNETLLISRCITTLRNILKRDQYLTFIIRWYSARNPPGSRDSSTEQEWLLFRNLLLSLMGCTAASQQEPENEMGNASPASYSHVVPNIEEPKKRRRHYECDPATDEDWDYLLHATALNAGDPLEGVVYSVDASAPLFPMLPAIFYSFHLLYEDLKLDAALHDYMRQLATFLHQLAIDMQLSTYIFHYLMDFPDLANKTTKVSMLTNEHGALMLHQELLHMPAPCVFSQVEHVLRDSLVLPYDYVDGINGLSRNVLQIVSLIKHGYKRIKHWVRPLKFPECVQSFYPPRPRRTMITDVPRSQQVIQMLISMGFTRKAVSRLPVAIHMIVAEALEQARLDPPIGGTAAMYEMILRPELVAHGQLLFADDLRDDNTMPLKENSLSPRCPTPILGSTKAQIPPRLDGMDHIDTKLLRLRFPDDMRVEEVRRLLTSSEPVLVDVQQLPGTSDHEFIEEQEKQLFALCARTMTLPFGRGMFTLRTVFPHLIESTSVPKLCLMGREPIKGSTVEMQQIEFPANMHMWPLYHNGVAAGLQISPQAKEINSAWIVYNKPKNQVDVSVEHAGFLMGLGLNGHLRTLSFMSIYEYLVKCEEMTSVGLLLGIAATHRGTMDVTTTKLMSVHIEALLPATALELDIPQNIQVASLMGIGLLYQGSAKRHIAEVLLQEIGRPPGPEMENSMERESYALTAGLALGLVTLGQGESPAGLRDLQLPDTLHYYMVGGSKRSLTGSQKEKYRLASFQVREGECVNIDVTAPGATLALGFMFFNSGNEAIAKWMAPPDTRYCLDLVRPDFLMLRTISHGLIMWHEVGPTMDWLQGKFPQTLRPHLNLPTTAQAMQSDDEEDPVDYEAIAQAYCNIIAGAAFCMALKYAGSENSTAFATLRTTIKEFLSFPGKPMGEYAGRTTVESCLMVLLISISLVNAGSGNCEILRIIRYLRSRVGPQFPQVTYGSHMAIHMSLGLLFLGAGRFSIAKTPEAIAALVIAFFPKFPMHSNDNRYHLQAFRHMYVLAVEPRLFLPRDIETHQLCLCHVSVLEIGEDTMRRLPIAPCILPELDTLQKVVVDDENYWPVCFERGRNWDQLVKALQYSACIDIKKRTGCLSHMDDPDRLKSLLAQTLTTEQYVCWHIDNKDLMRFSSEPFVAGFLDRFLSTEGTELSYEEQARRHKVCLLFYNAVVKDKMHVLEIYLNLYNHTMKMQHFPQVNDVWQVRLIEVYLSLVPRFIKHELASRELINMLQQSFKLQMEETLTEFAIAVHQFISHPLQDTLLGILALQSEDARRLMAVVSYYKLTPNLLNVVDLSSGTVNYLRILLEFKKLKIETCAVYAMLKVLQTSLPAECT